MNTAEDFIIPQGHVYQHNKKKLPTGLSKPAKLKNSRYFLNTPRILLFYFRKGKNAAQAAKKSRDVYGKKDLKDRQCRN